MVVRFSGSTVTADDLAESDDSELVEILLDQTSDAKAVLIFDNVDSYVDLENKTFTGLLDLLVQRFATFGQSSRLLLTCRPDVQYAASSVITIPVKGFSEEEALALFIKRAPEAAVPEKDILEAHALTSGHAFWLDLLAVQVINVPGTTLRKLLDDMRRGRDDVPDVLSSIWDKLTDRERTLLRVMAETVRPEAERTLERFVSFQLNYNKFRRALRSLISLNLIVVKPEMDAPDLYDLHPLVRKFVRTKFDGAGRVNYIRVVLRQYDSIIGAIESLLGIHLPLPMLERWSQKAELQVAAGLYEEAFETLYKVEGAFIGGGHLQEFIRVGRLLLESVDWESAAVSYTQFDFIVRAIVGALDQLGEPEAVDSLMARYEGTIPQKTTRYINFCDVRAHSLWTHGDFEGATEWAQKGVTLKTETNVDTVFDCGHTLALAQRDVGKPAVALEHFVKGYDLGELLSDAERVPNDGPMYGNVGRCLQLMGKADDALICYRRSLRILERDTSSQSKSNRAYGRYWVGQVLAAQGDLALGEAFLMDAIKILGPSAPIRVRGLFNDIKAMRGERALLMSEGRASSMVAAWLRQ